jgi:methyl-accepting chemotaxis protein
MFQPTRLLRRSIRAKILLAVVLPLLATALFASLFYPARQRAALLEKAEESVATLRSVLAFSVGAGLHDGNFELVQTAFNWAKENPQMVYVGILDEAGVPLVVHDPDSLDLRARVAAGDSLTTSGGRLVVTTQPIVHDGTNYGAVILGYSLREAHAAIAANNRLSLLFNLLIFALGTGTAYLFSRHTACQIVALRDTARAIGAGQHDVAVAVGSEDELGELSAAFRDMAGHLRLSFETVRQKTEDAEDAAGAARAAQAQAQPSSSTWSRASTGCSPRWSASPKAT